jgi:hypothetical protein
MWYVLLAILLVICLFKMKEPFQNKSSPKETPKSKQDPEQKDKPTQDKPEPKLQPKPTREKKIEREPIPYVQRNHVGVKEPLDSRLKCPSYYEDINKDILVEYQKISDAAYCYTPSRYLDVTRFVDVSKLKEPLPIEPDFFIHLK